MNERYLRSLIYLAGDKGAMREDLGLRDDPDDVGEPAECVVDLWAVVLFWRPIAGDGTCIQLSAGSPLNIATPFDDFVDAFRAAASARSYLAIVEEA